MRFIIFLATLLTSFTTLSAPLVDGGPNDYYDPTPRVQEVVNSVQNLHLYRAISLIKEGKTGYYTWEELDFTLRWFPNHPLGLKTMSDYQLKYSGAPPEKDAIYYFKAAIKFRPRDSIVRTLYGMHLHKIGKFEKALEQYKLAEQLQPDSADLQYNMGLLYIELKDFKNAVNHAEKAYNMGHPLPGLKNMLIKAGHWKSKKNLANTSNQN